MTEPARKRLLRIAAEIENKTDLGGDVQLSEVEKLVAFAQEAIEKCQALLERYDEFAIHDPDCKTQNDARPPCGCTMGEVWAGDRLVACHRCDGGGLFGPDPICDCGYDDPSVAAHEFLDGDTKGDAHVSLPATRVP